MKRKIMVVRSVKSRVNQLLRGNLGHFRNARETPSFVFQLQVHCLWWCINIVQFSVVHALTTHHRSQVGHAGGRVAKCNTISLSQLLWVELLHSFCMGCMEVQQNCIDTFLRGPQSNQGRFWRLISETRSSCRAAIYSSELRENYRIYSHIPQVNFLFFYFSL